MACRIPAEGLSDWLTGRRHRIADMPRPENAPLNGDVDAAGVELGVDRGPWATRN